MCVSDEMSSKSKNKGSGFERDIVNAARLHGIEAYRVPLSGAAEGFKDDIELRFGREVWRIEAKIRANGFKQIYGWKGEADILVIRADRQPALAVFDLDDFLLLLKEAKQ